jgi:hypothetical protein
VAAVPIASQSGIKKKNVFHCSNQLDRSYIDIFPINFGLKESGICGWVCTVIATYCREFYRRAHAAGNSIAIPINKQTIIVDLGK